MSAQYLRLGNAQWLYLTAALPMVLPCVLVAAFEQDAVHCSEA